eukprot:symbB.v1.2.041996.t1/scaffold9000.1/size4460/1
MVDLRDSGGQAGGASVTKRKRAERLVQNDMLNKLCQLLGTFLHDSASAPAGPKKKRKRKKKQVDSKPKSTDGQGLVDQLAKVVDDIRQNPHTLVAKLEDFLQHVKTPPKPVQTPPVVERPGSWVNVVKKHDRTKNVVNLARHCWGNGEIRDFGEVMKKLEVGETVAGSVALAPSLDKALEAQQLANAHNLQLKFACLVVGVDTSKLPSGVSAVTLPVSFSNGPGVQSTRFQKMACVLLGRESPSLPVDLVKQVQSAPPSKELATVRFFVPKLFLSKEQWQKCNAKASSMVLEWAGVSPTRSIHASYGWAATTQANWKGEKEDFVIGYAKVPVEKVDDLLVNSGRSGVFVDRLAKERDKKQCVSWVPFDAPDPVTYLNNVLSEAKAKKSAVAWRAGGGSCLGVRSFDEPTVSVVSVWRVKGVPFSWSDSDLLKVLTEAGWTDLTAVVFPTKKIRPWLLKAKAPDSVAGVRGIEAGDVLILVEKAGARSPLKRESKKLVSRPLAGGLPSSCGYNAIAIGSALVRGASWETVRDKCSVMGATLRVQVAMHVGKHVGVYKPLWSADTSEEKEDGSIPLDWDSWLVAIRRPKRWLCGLTIKAAATRLGIKVIVVLKQADQSWGMPVAFGSSKKKEQPVVLGLDEKAGHCILLVPDSPDAIPSSWLNAGECEVTMINQNVLRGAGKGEDDRPDRSWLPPDTPSSLPDLPRRQMEKSITAHLKKRHGRRAKRRLGKKLRERGHARRDWQSE